MSSTDPILAELLGPSPAHRVRRTLSAVYVASGLSLGGGQVFTLLLFGLLTPQQVGLVNWATAAATIVFYLFDLGVETSLVVQVKRVPTRLAQVVLVAGAVRLAVALLAFMAWLGGVALGILRPAEASALILIGLGFAVRSLQTPFTAHLQVHDRQATVAVVSVIPVLVRLVGVGLLWLAQTVALTPILLVMLFADVVGLLVLMEFARMQPLANRQEASGAVTLARGLVRSAPTIMLSQAVMIGQGRIDWLLVAALISYGALANYSIANKTLELLIIAGSMLGRTALPWMVEGWHSHSMPKTMRILTVALVAGGLILATAGPPLLRLLFGHKYAGAEPIIAPMATLAPALALYQVLQFMAFARSEAWQVVVSGLLGLTAQVIVDLLLIPSLGISGAVIGMFSFAGVAMPVQLWLAYRSRIIPREASLEIGAGAALLPFGLIGLILVSHFR